MTGVQNQRGGAPVGYVTELEAVEDGAVLYLRLWGDGPDAQSRVWNDFATALGPERGRSALKSFEDLCSLCVRYGRRPLMRHNVTCKCLGSDEACFANFVGAATDGEREDAFLIATNIVRADVAGSLVALAEQFGLALRQMSLAKQHTNHPTTGTEPARTLH